LGRLQGKDLLKRIEASTMADSIPLKTHFRPTAVTVDLSVLRGNFARIQAFVGPDVPVMAAVKADAYGHGLVEVATALQAEGCAHFGVALVAEGRALRKAGIRGQILCLGGVHNGAKEALEFALTPTVFDLEGVEQINALGAEQGAPIEIHVKIDTGMSRLGVQAQDWPEFAAILAAQPFLRVAGLFSHCSNADFPEKEMTLAQNEAFLVAVSQAKAAGLQPEILHLANSAATLRFPEMHHAMVRVGIALYGVAPIPDCPVRLEPVMTVQTQVLAIKDLPANTGVSYGRRWESDRPARIATLPVGYADGYSRALSECAQVIINGHRCPVRGSICMDLMMVDVTDCHRPVKKGDAVVLLGKGLSAAELAGWSGTIPYEILTGFSGRIQRSFHGLAKSV
jgi:alanine racemase